MAANLADHSEITVYQTVSGNTDETRSINEAAGQTFVKGTPVQLNAGNIQAWDGATVAKGVAGITMIDASNYASAGAGAPGAFGQVGAPGALVTYGKVPHQASGVNIPAGSPAVDGRTLFNLAQSDTLFLVQVDNSAFAVAADATPVQADIGKQFGLTIDATGHWYLDRAKTTAGTNTVVVVRAIDPVFGSVLNGNVVVEFILAACQLVN